MKGRGDSQGELATGRRTGGIKDGMDPGLCGLLPCPARGWLRGSERRTVSGKTADSPGAQPAQSFGLGSRSFGLQLGTGIGVDFHADRDFNEFRTGPGFHVLFSSLVRPFSGWLFSGQGCRIQQKDYRGQATGFHATLVGKMPQFREPKPFRVLKENPAWSKKAKRKQ